MLFTKIHEGTVWIESEDKSGKTRHLVAGSDSYDDRAAMWEEVVATLPRLNQIIARYGLQEFAMVNYSANGLLSVSFHTHDDIDFPDNLVEAQQAIVTELAIEVRNGNGEF